MKELTVITRNGCPYCEHIGKNIDAVMEQFPEYRDINIKITEESEADAGQYEHYYAPAFFCGDREISEGDGSCEAIKAACERIMQMNKSDG